MQLAEALVEGALGGLGRKVIEITTSPKPVKKTSEMAMLECAHAQMARIADCLFEVSTHELQTAQWVADVQVEKAIAELSERMRRMWERGDRQSTKKRNKR